VDAGFTPGEKRKTWLTRRHRNVYRVLCDDDRIYELYLDRSGSLRRWHLVGCLTPDLPSTARPRDDGDNR